MSKEIKVCGQCKHWKSIDWTTDNKVQPFDKGHCICPAPEWLTHMADNHGDGEDYIVYFNHNYAENCLCFEQKEKK